MPRTEGLTTSGGPFAPSCDPPLVVYPSARGQPLRSWHEAEPPAERASAERGNTRTNRARAAHLFREKRLRYTGTAGPQ